MPEPADSPFRRKSLERLSSPERLDQLLRIVDRKTWLPLATLSVLLLVLSLWSILGRIPVTVEGRGILVQPRKIVEFDSPGTGRLEQLDIEVDQVIEAGAVLGKIARPDLIAQIDLRGEKLDDLRARSEAAAELRSQRTALEEGSSRTQQERLAAHIRRSETLADDLRRKRRAAIEDERSALKNQLAVVSLIPEQRNEHLDGQRAMYDDGMISEQALLTAKEAYMESLALVADLENRLATLVSDELEAEEDYLNRRQALSDQRFELGGLRVRDKALAQENLESERSYEQQMAELRVEIAALERQRDEDTMIIAEHRGKIIEISAMVGQELEPGDRLGSMVVADPGARLVSLSYFSVRDGKRLSPRKEIQVSPDTAERRRFGSIRGAIDSISPYPVTSAEVHNVIGNREVAESLLRGAPAIQVFSELETDPDSFTGYRWMSSTGPDLEITPGTTTTARAVIEHRRPLDFVLPFLRGAAGID